MKPVLRPTEGPTMSVYRIGDSDYADYVIAESILQAVEYYAKNIDAECLEEQGLSVTQCDMEKEGFWIEITTEEAIESVQKLADRKDSRKVKLRNFGIDQIAKWITFEDYLTEDDIKTPTVIASQGGEW